MVSLTVDMKCLKQEELTSEVKITAFKTSECSYFIEFESADACPLYTVTIFMRFISVWSWTHAFFIMLGGAYLAMWGYKKFRTSLILMGMATVYFTVMITVS